MSNNNVNNLDVDVVAKLMATILNNSQQNSNQNSNKNMSSVDPQIISLIQSNQSNNLLQTLLNSGHIGALAQTPPLPPRSNSATSSTNSLVPEATVVDEVKEEEVYVAKSAIRESEFQGMINTPLNNLKKVKDLSTQFLLGYDFLAKKVILTLDGRVRSQAETVFNVLIRSTPEVFKQDIIEDMGYFIEKQSEKKANNVYVEELQDHVNKLYADTDLLQSWINHVENKYHVSGFEQLIYKPFMEELSDRHPNDCYCAITLQKFKKNRMYKQSYTTTVNILHNGIYLDNKEKDIFGLKKDCYSPFEFDGAVIRLNYNSLTLQNNEKTWVFVINNNLKYKKIRSTLQSIEREHNNFRFIDEV